jgi:hemolysin activation/secretion protein
VVSGQSTAVDSTLERRRAEERQDQLREQQERAPDVRLQAPAESATAAGSDRFPDAEVPCFVIRHLELKAEETRPFRGLLTPLETALPFCLGTQGINVVLKRVQNALVDRGMVTTRVLVEPQDMNQGTLVLTVIPGRIQAIHFADDNDNNQRAVAWNALPAKAGDLLNLRDIEQGLENFKRVPTVEADIQIQPAQEPGAAPGASDLVISHHQSFPFRLSFSVDDSGTEATGKDQGSVTLSYDNWWTLNDLFYISANRDLNHVLGTGPSGERGTRGGSVHYSIPYGYWLLSTTASNNTYHQSVAGANQTYEYSGTSSNGEVKLTRVVYRNSQRKTTVAVRAFSRQSNNYIDDTEIEVQRRKVGGWQADLSHREFIGTTTLDANLSWKQGTGAFGALPAPEQAFDEGTSRFRLITADSALNLPFSIRTQKLRYSASWRAQWQRTPLTPQDRFAIGGRYTVRGFDGESVLSAERGWLIRNDLSLALGQTGQELYLGVDTGQVGGPSSAALIATRMSGAVLGLRGGYQSLAYDVFMGRPLRKPDGFKTESTVTGFSLNWSI